MPCNFVLGAQKILEKHETKRYIVFLSGVIQWDTFLGGIKQAANVAGRFEGSVMIWHQPTIPTYLVGDIHTKNHVIKCY